MERRSLVKCVRLVLMQCIRKESDCIHKVANFLHETQFVSSAQYRMIVSNVKNGFLEEACGSLAELTFEKDAQNWKENLFAAVSVLPGEDSLKELIGLIFRKSSDVSSEAFYLLEICDKMMAKLYEIAQLQGQIWPEMRSSLNTLLPNHWLTELLLKCLKEDRQDQVHRFANGVKNIVNNEMEVSRQGDIVQGMRTLSVDVRSNQMSTAGRSSEARGLVSSNTTQGIDLRVVLSGVVEKYDVCVIYRDHNDWTMVKMTMMSCGDIYRYVIPPSRGEELEYRYCLSDQSGIIKSEHFPDIGSHDSTRVLYLEELKRCTIVQDVASFPDKRGSAKPWKLSCQDDMLYHLVAAEYSLLVDSDKEKFCQTLSCWLYRAKHGWRLRKAHPDPVIIPPHVTQDILYGWFGKLTHRIRRQSGNIQVIVTALAILVAFHVTRSMIVHDKLLIEIFMCLEIHQLAEEQQLSLFNEISQNCKRQIGGSLDAIREALEASYRRLYGYAIPDFLLSLPIYWLISGRDDFESHLIESRSGEDFLLLNSGLPRALKLYDVKSAFGNNSAQRSLVRFSKVIAQISRYHPTIIGCYQFLLKDATLLEMITSRDEISHLFPIESVLYQLLTRYASNRGEIKISDFAKLTEYFEDRFNEMTQPERNYGNSGGKNEAKNHKACRLIVDWVSGFLADVTSTTEAPRIINECVLWCLKIGRMTVALSLARAHSGGDMQLEITELLEAAFKMSASVSNWIHKCPINETQLLFLNDVVKLDWPEEKLFVKWRETIKNELQDKLAKEWPDKKDQDFLEFYAKTLETIGLQETVESCLSEKAFLCTGRILAKYSFDNKSKKSYASAVYKNMMSWIKKPRFIAIFDRLFQKEHQKAAVRHNGNPPMQALTVLFSWPFALQFYELFYREEALSKFSEKTQNLIISVAEHFAEIVRSLISGDIIVAQLQQIANHREIFIDLCKRIEVQISNVDHGEVNLLQLIEKRQKQLFAYETATEHIRGFLQACSKLDEGGECMVRTTELKEKLRDSANVVNKVLSHISPEEGCVTSSKSFLKLTPAILKHFEEISFVKDSKVFQEMFHQNLLTSKAEGEGDGCDLGDNGLWHVPWREVVDRIWKDTRSDITECVQAIDDGSMSLETMKEWFQRCNDPKVIRREVATLYQFYRMVSGIDEAAEAAANPKPQEDTQSRLKDSDDSDESGPEDSDEESVPSEYDPDSDYTDDEEEEYETVVNMKLRSEQLASFFMLEKAEETVRILLEIRDVLDLSGDFSPVERMKERMSITGHIVNLPNDIDMPVVCKIAENQIQFLKCFIKERELIAWLKESMNDIRDVQVMCDLALMKAGETPYEVDIVSCLLGAVMGFAPLIFDLDVEAGFEELLARCDGIWKNIGRDDKLLEKWSDTGKHLAWFRGVGNARGSVEKQSLDLAREINRHGVYTIGRKDFAGAISYKDCVSLAVPNEQNERYDLDKLFDLQCKLMLIAGDSDSGWGDVSNFVNVLEIVRHVAETFVKLVRSGCMLFNRWSAVIRCNNADSDQDDSLLVEIQFGDNCPPLTGSTSIADLSKLSNILNESLSRWKDYVDDMRMKFYFLNAFNMPQIIYLCRELATKPNKISDQVSTLLSFVGNSCPEMDLQEILDDAMKIVDAPPQDLEANVEHDKITLVRRLMAEEDITEDTAKAAVQAECGKDEPDYLTWILMNQFEEETIAQLRDEFNRESESLHRQMNERNIVNILYDRSADTLERVISRLQTSAATNSAMDSVEAICKRYHDETTTITLQDSLSIQHLGKFLNLFREKHRGPKVARNLVEPFAKGRPNLAMCHEHEILHSVLYLYMMDRGQPLPTVSEVLLCSESTTVDEVERFMRRAMCETESSSKMLFTLAFADKLNFNVSAATEQIFNQLTSSTKNADYQLVILLSKPQHYIATCFDKFLIEGKWMAGNPDVTTYLENNLKLSRNLKSSAALADRDHSTVRVVNSMRSGVGKSLYVQRTCENLKTKCRKTTVRLLERAIDTDYVVERLLRPIKNQNVTDTPLIVHIDLTPAVEKGIESFVFNLLVLGSLQDSDGYVWKKDPHQLYMIEVTLGDHREKEIFSSRHILKLLPFVSCSPPRKILENLESGENDHFVGMDEKEFRSETYQRPFQYLTLYDVRKGDLDDFRYTKPAGTHKHCLQVLLNHCCAPDPSWAQLRHFASFLNVQLRDCENSIFCDRRVTGNILRGLRPFAIDFMIRMSQDFATPSLVISDESASRTLADPDAQDARLYRFRRKWEESAHPYMFFNEDRVSLTFINVNISDDGNLLDKNGETVVPSIISPHLVQGLKTQGVSLDLNFDTFTREKKLETICQVMGVEPAFDPDPTYKLTTDNVLKILAVYMRFRCQIPVIVMGETGCGKTRMVDFISKLKAGSNPGPVQGMVTLKIHGGVTVNDIYRSVQDACVMSRSIENFGIVLFYDEANTTEAIYALKEVMCDVTVDGESFQHHNLKIVAACNPYKQLSSEAIQKLEDSGLGYRVKTCDTTHLFGNVPIRTLVYRVVALPPSMQPFVWDFGQLGAEAEKIYVQQMTMKLGEKLGLNSAAMRMFNVILCAAQKYMRSRPDECRYVSLRDVERCIVVYEWFYRRRETLYPEIEREIKQRYSRMTDVPPHTSDELRTLIQTVGVCYHASLGDRRRFRERISEAFIEDEENLYVSDVHIREEILAAQAVFLRDMKTEDNIALNDALQENAFMMAVCADMRIPLFLIGKPGTSKSLAKTIVGDNMRGALSHSALCKQLKQIHIISYQCSALTDAIGIETVFKQCGQLQAKQDPDAYSSVVVLDEIGLAEDSPNMPLKVLHPLLEGSGIGQASGPRVGFIGISNWALDPAKMNRGIFVNRSKPTRDDLKKTAKGIFRNQKSKINENLELLNKLTESYMKVYEDQDVEYFGLRDHYGLIKMLHAKCKSAELTVRDVTMAIHRNFSGGKRSLFEVFRQNIQHLYNEIMSPTVPLRNVISDNLSEKESRYLLLLTNQVSAASLLQLCVEKSSSQIQIIFGSSFPGDHKYTDVCRNINKIKAYMETGKSVVLLNMTEIHESLYDALNQHYVTFGGQRYVDLGLGGHRVKCRVAPEFRLIVVEQKEVVYARYPIPLINRLEKHHLDSKSLLSAEQTATATSLEEWVDKFRKVADFRGKDAFSGYHSDTVCSIVLSNGNSEDQLRNILLESASMDAVFRLEESNIGGQCEDIQKFYLRQQTHDDLLSLLRNTPESDGSFITEIVSYSNVLSENDRSEIEARLGRDASVTLLSLEQFQTERVYNKELDRFLKKTSGGTTGKSVLLIQCAQAQSRGRLVECAKFSLKNKLKARVDKHGVKNMIVAILLSAEREGNSALISDTLSLQHAADNKIVYVDELRPSEKSMRPASFFYKKTIVDVLKSGDSGQDESCPRKLVDIKALLNDCVCDAVSRVQSRHSNSGRYLERIAIISNLFGDSAPIGEDFRKVLVTKLVRLYSEDGQVLYATRPWTVAEACSRENLQEAGTFRKTLWLSLKARLSRLIAYVISVADRQNNLDLLTSDHSWVAEMWIGVFKVLQLSWSSIGRGLEFVITEQPHHKVTVPCRIPFSFLIHKFLRDQWDTLNEQNSTNLVQALFSFYRKSDFCDIVGKASVAAGICNFIECYTADLVEYAYVAKSGSEKEIVLVTDIIRQLSMERYNNSINFNEGDECPIVFVCYQSMSDNLKVFSDILRLFPDLLELVNWSRNDNVRNIHVFAFKELLKILAESAEKMKDSDACLSWKRDAMSVKKLYKQLRYRIDRTADKASIDQKWGTIEFVCLFLDHLIPDDMKSGFFRDYLSLISTKAHFLWRYSNRGDGTTFEVLKITLNVLKHARQELYNKLLIDWQDSMCSICRKSINTPVKLPCGHFNCEDCVRRLLMAFEGVWRCPKCNKEIPHGYCLSPAVLDDGQTAELKRFESNCTSFFVEYVARFCFKFSKKSPPDMTRKMVDSLASQIVLQSPVSKELEIDLTAVDLNVNFKTCTLRILLDNCPEITKDVLEDKMAGVTRDEMETVVCVILKCFQDQAISDVNSDAAGPVEELERWRCLFDTSYKRLASENETEGLKLEMLRAAAEVRCCLTEAACRIQDIFKKVKLADDVNAKTDLFLSDLIRVGMSDDSGVSALKKFLVKSAFHVYGSDWFYQMRSNDNFESLVPVSLDKDRDNEKTDRWVLLGNEYVSEVTKMYKIPEKEQVCECARSMVNMTQNGIKIFASIAVIYDKDDAEKDDFNSKVTENLPKNPSFLYTAGTIFSKFLPLIRKSDDLTETQIHTVFQLVTTIVYAVTDGNIATAGFALMLSNPRSVENSFLPGMPESAIYSIPEDMRTQRNSMMYTCPNGHLYAVGECRQPMETARCPDCGATIGGQNHRAAAGNQRYQGQEEWSQAGYLLNAGGNAVVEASDRISKQGAAVVHTLVHACMLVGLQNDPVTVARMVHVGTEENAANYLLGELLKNLDAFANALGRNMDEAILVLYDIVLTMKRKKTNAFPDWSSMQSRKNWEQAFRQQYLTPAFQKLDKTVADSAAIISNAEQKNVKALYKLAHELEFTGKSGKSNFKWTDPLLWLHIRRPDSSHLLQVLEDRWDVENSILKIIMKTTNLGMLKYLESVLLLQSALIDKYQNNIDMDDAEKITLKNFENDGGQPYRKYMDDYITIWNKLCPALRAKYSLHERVLEYLEPVSILSPISVALPSARGKGLCAKLLAEHLIDLQNDFLTECKQVLEGDDSIHECKVVELYHSDYVQIDTHADLLPLIQMHTKYDITRDKGRHHHISYNVSALEKQVRENFVMYRKLIAKRSLPMMQYPQDVGIGNDWDKVLENTAQVVLPGRIAQDLDQMVSGVTSADVCEGVRTLAQAITFLAKVQINPGRNMVDFLEKDLILPPNCIPRSAQIEHTLSVYNRLSWHKAVSFTTRGLNPYKDATGDQKPISSKKLLADITEAFKHTDVIVLQQKLNEVLIKKTDFNSNWSLKDIFPYYEFLGDTGDDDSWYERLPDEVSFKHIRHLFTLTVQHRRNALRH